MALLQLGAFLGGGAVVSLLVAKDAPGPALALLCTLIPLLAVLGPLAQGGDTRRVVRATPRAARARPAPAPPVAPASTTTGFPDMFGGQAVATGEAAAAEEVRRRAEIRNDPRRSQGLGRTV